jgi:hypothetical protein
MANPEDTTGRPTASQRLLYSIPLFLFFAILAFLACALPWLDQWTRGLLYPQLRWPPTLVAVFPYIFGPTMFAFAYVYLAWGCRTHRRMVRFAWAMSFLIFVLVSLAAAWEFWPEEHVIVH